MSDADSARLAPFELLLITFFIGVAVGIASTVLLVESELESFFSGEQGLSACRAFLDRAR
jgi:hypothetical protein